MKTACTLYAHFQKTHSAHAAILDTPLAVDDFAANKIQRLTQYKNCIHTVNAFIDDTLRQNTTAHLCNIHSTLLTDAFALRVWALDTLISRIFGAVLVNQAALFAIGGYGRGEVLPHSDVDLLIIHPTLTAQQTDALKDFVAHLWDMGIYPAVRIHHIDDDACVLDSTIATSLLENRFLAGERALQPILRTWLDTHYSAEAFFCQKFAEYKTRHKKQGDSEYVLEPNIKEGVGALRDIHFLHWMGKFYFRLPPDITLRDLVDLGFLDIQECHTLMRAKHFFWLIRHHIHTIEQKNTDTLNFGLQKTIAERMGYPQSPDNPNHAPECLMRTFYRHAMQVATLSALLAELFYYEHIKPYQSKPLTASYALIEGDFGEEILAHAGVFERDLGQVLEIFLIMGEHGIKKIAPRTLRDLRTASARIDSDFIQNDAHRRLFLQNLDEPNYLFHRLRLMKRTGVLGAYLPAFGKIIGLTQYDLFHSYTVDAHTLFLIRVLHRLYRDDFGLLSTVYKELDNPLILVIAAIFHDIAKGTGLDHSQEGARLVQQFCAEHHINEKDSALITWLVCHHLDMSITAQKKDIYDPDIIQNFADFVGSIRYLDYLYVFTVADMNATNSQLWNHWRASLLRQLYLSVHARLDKNSDSSPKTIIAQKKSFAAERLDHPQLAAFWQGLPDSYFLRHSKHDILWHAQTILSTQNTPTIAIIPHKNKSLRAQKLLIYTPNLPSIFALTVAILDQFGFAVYSADILTDQHNFALDTYAIVHKQQSANTQNDNAHLMDTLVYYLPNPSAFFAQYTPKPYFCSDKLRHFAIKTQVSFEDNQNGTHTLYLITKDRAGLLAQIGQVFGNLGIWVHTAKIMTLGERAEDVFCVSQDAHTPLDNQKQAALKDALLLALG